MSPNLEKQWCQTSVTAPYSGGGPIFSWQKSTGDKEASDPGANLSSVPFSIFRLVNLSKPQFFICLIGDRDNEQLIDRKTQPIVKATESEATVKLTSIY